MPISHLPADSAPEDVAALISEHGAVIVDHVAPQDLLDQIEVDLAPYLEATPTGPDDFSGQHTRRSGALIARSEACRELVTHPLAIGTTKVFLGHASNFQLHLTQAIALPAWL